LPRARGIFLWLAVHGGAALALALSAALGRPPALDTDLLRLLPRSKAPHGEAERILRERSSRNAAILCGGGDVNQVREAAEAFYLDLGGEESSGLFEELRFSMDETFIEELSAWLHEYRYMLLEPRSVLALERGGAAELAEEALARSYGAFTFSGLDRIDSDPFLLTEGILRSFLDSPLLNNSNANGGLGLSPQDGILTAEFEGTRYVLVQALLSETGASIKSGRGVREIYRAAAETKKRFDGVDFVFSGVPFHSYESASRAQREIALLSGLTLALLLILFIRVFRSALPVFLIIFAVLLSIGFGLAAAFLVFGTIHIFTLVFGASLTGLCVDYAIHFLLQRRRGLSGPSARRAVLRGTGLSFASSMLCFFVFLFAPFDILRQFALFSAAGLSSSCLTVLCLFPALPGSLFPPGRIPARSAGPAAGPGGGEIRRRRIIIALTAGILPALVIAGGGGLDVHNDLRSLYRAPPKLLEGERIASSILNYRAEDCYFLISGADPQETLERDEAFLALLAEAEAGPFLGVSLFIPPVRTQERRRRAAAALLPLAENQYRALGFSPGEARLSARALEEDYAAGAGRHALPPGGAPDGKPGGTETGSYAGLLRNLFIGEASGRWYSVILSRGEIKKDRSALAALAEKQSGVFMAEKTAGLSPELDALTRTMFKLLALACGIMTAALGIYYRRAAAILRMIVVLLLAALTGMAVHVLLGQSLTFFSAAGAILVLGLGLDYLFYLTEDRKAQGAAGAVILSFATTALSFGALLFSSFTPVRLLALAVVPGLAAAFAAAMVLREPSRHEP
jgi:predicted exporter